MTTQCLATVRETISRYRWIAPGETLLVAVSGGGDSVALLALLAELRGELGFNLHAVHVNHHLRPDADADAAWVADSARAYDIPVTVSSIDVGALARQEKQSLEEAGRTARYGVFAEVATRVGARLVATGHTHDDQVETVLMRLLQETRWRALAGIPPSRPLGSAMVVRPLYALTHLELIAYLCTRGLSWREDSTNLDRRILRNRIRIDLLPTLVGEEPAFRDLLSSAGEVVAASNAWLLSESRRVWGQLAQWNGTSLALNLHEFYRYPREVQRDLVMMALEAVTGMDHPLKDVALDDVVRLGIGSAPGGELKLGVCEVRRSYKTLEFLPPQPEPAQERYMLRVPGTVTAEAFGVTLTAERMVGSSGGGMPPGVGVCLDGAAIGSSLEIRPWRPGDRMTPAGLGGRKKLQDIFVDAKVPRWDRRRVPVVVDAQGRIIWVVGHRVAESARVTPATTEVVRIQVDPILPVRA